MLGDERRVIMETLDSAFRFSKILIAAAAIAVLFSGIKYVKSDEVALVIRLGRLAGDSPAKQVHGPGLLLAWPYLIDQVIRVPVKRVQELRISDFSGIASNGRSEPSTNEAGEVIETLDPTAVGYCVTGDHNIIHTDILVKYTIKDPIRFALHVSEPISIIRNAVCESLTSNIGAAKVDWVLAEGKKSLSSSVLKQAQADLDIAESGIMLAAIEFSEIKPPKAVVQDFEAVMSEYVEKQTKVQKAQTYRESEVPKAQSERTRLISDAEAYSAKLLGDARGEVATFKNVIAEYRSNPSVVSEQLYYEALDRIMSKVGSRVIVPKRGNQTRIMLPAKPTEEAQPLPPSTPEPDAKADTE